MMDMILSRRSFLKKLGYTLIGGLIVPYVPKTFYSFPDPILEMSIPELEAYLQGELTKRFTEDLDKEMALILNGDPAFYSEFGEPLGILSLVEEK